MNILDQIHLEEIKHNPKHLRTIENPSPELQIAALKLSITNVRYIKPLHPDARNYLLNDAYTITEEDRKWIS